MVWDEVLLWSRDRKATEETRDLSEKMTFKKSNYIQISFYFWSFFLLLFFSREPFLLIVVVVDSVLFHSQKIFIFDDRARFPRETPRKINWLSRFFIYLATIPKNWICWIKEKEEIVIENIVGSISTCWVIIKPNRHLAPKLNLK